MRLRRLQSAALRSGHRTRACVERGVALQLYRRTWAGGDDPQVLRLLRPETARLQKRT
jgi:hypothetical protein